MRQDHRKKNIKKLKKTETKKARTNKKNFFISIFFLWQFFAINSKKLNVSNYTQH